MKENNWTWEGAFYRSEWAKINSSWVIFIFSLYKCSAANASELFHMAYLENNEGFLYPSKLSF